MNPHAPPRKALLLLLALMLMAGCFQGASARTTDVVATTTTDRQVGSNATVDASYNVSVDVLFHFGDGNYSWGSANGLAGNSTAFDLTLMAASSIDLGINWSNSTYGAFITSIGYRSPPPDYSEFWNFYIWNQTSGTWQLSVIGASSYIVTTNTSLAWSFDRWGDSSPVPTPLYPDPELIPINVLIDFSNGTYQWEDVILWDSHDSAFNATELATQELGLRFQYDTYSFGNMVTRIGDSENAPDLSKSWLLWLWNGSSFEWEYSPIGASDLHMQRGDVIAWQYDNWGDSPPVPSPNSTYLLLIRVDVLMDFGNGTYFWEDVVVPKDYPQIYITTEMVAYEHALKVTWIGMGCAGCTVWIDHLGGNKTLPLDSQDWKWQLWIWDESIGDWSPVEEIYLANLTSGGIIAWEYSWPLSEGPDPNPYDLQPTINLPPQVGMFKTIGLDMGTSANFTIPVFDPENTSLRFSLEVGPSFVSIDEDWQQLLISDSSEPGIYPITITVTDTDPLNPKSVTVDTKLIISEPREEDTTVDGGDGPDLDLLYLVFAVLIIIILSAGVLQYMKKNDED